MVRPKAWRPTLISLSHNRDGPRPRVFKANTTYYQPRPGDTLHQIMLQYAGCPLARLSESVKDCSFRLVSGNYFSRRGEYVIMILESLVADPPDFYGSDDPRGLWPNFIHAPQPVRSVPTMAALQQAYDDDHRIPSWDVDPTLQEIRARKMAKYLYQRRRSEWLRARLV